MVERHLAKVNVASSNLVFRSITYRGSRKVSSIEKLHIQLRGSGSVVERHLAKVNVASSNLVFRSMGTQLSSFFYSILHEQKITL